MGWLPDWFQFSSEFGFALLAFLGSLAVVHYDRRLVRQDDRDDKILSQWAEIHSIGSRVFMPMQMALRARDIGDISVHRDAILQVTTLRGEAVSVFFRALDAEVRNSAGDLDDICGHFLSNEKTLTLSGIQANELETIEAIRSESGLQMAKIANRGVKSQVNEVQQLLDRYEAEDPASQSDIMAPSKNGDTPPA